MNGRGRRRLLDWLFFVVAVAGLCGAGSPAFAGEYRTVEVEFLRITLDSEWAVRTAPGYLPVRFDITNLGEPRVIENHRPGHAVLQGAPARPWRRHRPCVTRCGWREVTACG